MLDTVHSLLPLVIILALFITLLKEWLEPDVAAWAAVVVILVLGLLPTEKALQALSNPAPVTVACMFILGAALEKTGVVALLGHGLGRWGGRSELSVMLVLCVFAAVVSAFLNNTAVVAVLMPVALGLARSKRFSASKLLLPLSYASILGGTCRLIGTSTNLSVQGVLRNTGEPLLGFFEFTSLGVIYAVVGITYLATVGRHLLPAHAPVAEEPQEAQLPPLLQYVVVSDSQLIGKTLVVTLLARVPDVDVLEVRRRGVPLQERLDGLGIRAGDRLLVTPASNSAASQAALEDAAKLLGLRLLESRAHGAVEAIVPADSPLEDMPIGDLRLRQRFAVRVIQLVRNGNAIKTELSALELKAGDQLRLTGPTEGLERVLLETELVRVQTRPAIPVLSRQGWTAAGLFLTFVLGSALHDVLPQVFRLPVEGMALLCAVGLMVTRCLDHPEIYQHVNWHVVFLISGMLIVGAMLEHTGTAAQLAQVLAMLVNGAPPWVVVSTTYLVAMVLTELISNNAVATMLTPIAVGLAHQLGFDARPLVMAVLFASSASFSTPVGYQTNTFIYGVGGYRFADFLRVGLPLNFLLWAVASVLIPWFWPMK